MVCRENKGRSAVMGLHKALLRRQGYTNFDDHEFQSGIHEFGHAYAGAGAPPHEQQVEFLQGLRQQVENDPHISDAEKFRISDSQPGLITRIDQEISRMRTGKDENGRVLTAAQQMRGRDWAAMARMGGLLRRGQEAKEQYFETYARHTGVSMDEARSEFRSLATRPAAVRENTRIALKDSWRDDLSVAGVSSETQADVGQSNQTREAIRLMESRRAVAVESRPTRPSIRPEHERKVLSPAEAKRLQCTGDGACGQFGHDRPACPNQALLADQATATRDLRAAEAELSPNGSDEVARMRARRKVDRTAERLAKIEQSLADSEPILSNEVDGLAYNPENGVLRITTKPRRNVRTGTVSPGADYHYRVPEAEYRNLLASGDITSGLARSVWRRGRAGGADDYHFENEADAKEALVQRNCPTCGQFASLNSGHKCAVPGSRQDAAEAQRSLAIKTGRELARANGAEIAPPSPPKTQWANTSVTVGTPDGASLHFAGQNSTAGHLADGKVVRAQAQGLYRGASTEGTVPVWDDAATGQRFIGGADTQMNCTCPAYRKSGSCAHTEQIVDSMAAHYGAERYAGPAGGSKEVEEIEAEEIQAAKDAPQFGMTRRDYTRIRDLRRTNARATAQAQTTTGARWMFTAPPTDRTGTPVAMPTQWASGERTVDLSSPAAVQAEMRRALRARSASEKVPGGKHWSVRKTKTGALLVTTAVQRQGRGGAMSPPERRELARLLGMPVQRVSPRGAFVPADEGWRSEFLDRTSGRAPQVMGGRLVAPGFLVDRDAATA